MIERAYVAGNQKTTKEGNGKEKAVSFLTHGIIDCYYLLAIGLPLAICLSANDVVTLPKAALLWTVSAIVLFCYLSSGLLKARLNFCFFGFGPPLLTLLLVFLTSTLFSVHPATSLIGDYQRYEGAITFFCYFVLFLVAAQVFDNKKKIEPFLMTVVLTGAFLSVYGLLQFFGLEFLPWSKALFEKQRSFATFGNPVYFGAYLSLIFPLATARYLDASERQKTFLFGTATVLIFSCLITTGSRAAWLGALVGSMIFGSVWGFKKMLKRKAAILIFLFAVIAVLFFSGLSAEGTQDNSFDLATRFTGLFKLEAGAQRFELWKAAVIMVGGKPLIGYGPSSFRSIANRFMSLKLARTSRGMMLADSPHNYFLQIASATGIIGLLAFVWLLFVWSAQAMRAYSRTRESDLFALGIISGLAAYLLALQFGISSVGATPIFWVLAGLLFSTEKKGDLFSFRIKLSLQLRLIGVSVLSLFFLLLILYPVRFVRADILYRQAENSFKISEQVDLYLQASKLNPYNCLYPAGAGLVYDNLASQMRSPEYFQQAVSYYSEAKSIAPQQLEGHYYLGSLYFFASECFDPSYGKSAEEELKKAVEIFPYYLPSRLKTAEFYYRQKEYLKTISEADVIIKVASQDDRGYLWKGKALLALGRDKEARSCLAKALRLNAQNKEAVELLESADREK